MTNDPIVHYVRRFSGMKEDETALCGADAWHRTTIGETHDTAGQPMRICAECAKLAPATATQVDAAAG